MNFVKTAIVMPAIKPRDLTNKQKELTLPKLEAKLWKVFSEFIRLRDSDENGYCKCFTCGRVRYFTDMDSGHGIPRQYKATKYNERNNAAQCKHCNGFEGGRRETYKQKMDEKYGKGTWDIMEMCSRKPYKYSRFEILALTEYYKGEVYKLRQKKNLK